MADYTLPPLPAVDYRPNEKMFFELYGRQCAEVARAPLLEHIERLKNVMRGVQDGWNDDYRLLQEAKARIAALEAAIVAQCGEPVAVRFDFDGYGWRYIDNGSGSDWLTRHKDGEPLYAAPPSQPVAACSCKERPLSACQGEWEPGCDLGNNEKYAVPSC